MKALAPILLLLLTVGALTACGSSAPPRPSPAAAPVADVPSTETGVGSDPGPGGIGAAVDVCALLPAAGVATTTGMAVTVATPEVTSGPGEHMCLYSDAGGGNALSIWLNATTGTQAYAADFTSQEYSAKKIDGLGDRAFFSVVGLEALFGSTLIKVSGVDDVAAATALAKALAAQL